MKRRSFLKLLGSLPAGWGITRIDSEAKDPVEKNIKEDIQEEEEYDIDPNDPYFSLNFRFKVDNRKRKNYDYPPDKDKRDMSDKDLWI